MKTYGKTIRLFLSEGTPNGLTTAELSNWTGLGIKVPRIKVKDSSKRPEFQKPGIYILLGKDEANNEAAYIGEAEVIADRLNSHLATKEFWNEVVFFTSKDKYLNKASVKYLEHRLHDTAIKAERVKLLNGNTPTRSELSEAEQAELEEFLSNIKLLTSTLGHKLFEAIEDTLETTADNVTQLFYCKNAAGANATGSPSTEGFIVFKDSLFLKEHMTSVNESIRLEKAKMIEDGYFSIEGELLRLTRHYTFTSSSRAAAMVLGRSSNGRTEWKTEKGVMLKQLEE
ncbi:uncharacterized protein DUF4357 [Lacibacter cauensis]|uniref:Uncharacterized protein DUF4357 n=1 Tax=Lacibacter cauensis TaxID=510947 RepID=A0A562SPR8_9BACT|nr:GIY-YIG nuclease family protein [Lacibacter cauensis]TWI83275.1 uncharacterized protein DUF4357 [Lacibacter cauensis]